MCFVLRSYLCSFRVVGQIEHKKMKNIQYVFKLPVFPSELTVRMVCIEEDYQIKV